jgi:flagellar hook assembly protein FlgD
VLFTPASKPQEEATLTYNTNELQSGDYILKAKVRDATGNLSSEDGYQIHFKVIREASISNIYPYPNPFSTQMKFVYTLTGSQIPDYMKIQILTITGKVVREISQDELGVIRIGNNITEFTWYGTDEFGDQLANGVYLYKVTSKINGEELPTMETSGDSFFTNGFGKIYLAR